VKKETAEEEDDLKVYNLDTYDENSDEDEAKQGSSFGLFSNVKGLSFHNSNEEDPYITLKDVFPFPSFQLTSRMQLLRTTNEKNYKYCQLII
jgi:hypothetical protein